MSDILGTNSFDFEKVYSTAGWIKTFEEHIADADHDDDEHEHEEHDHHHDHDEHEHDEHEHGHEHHGEHDDEDGHHHGHDEHEHHHGHHHHHHDHEGGEVEEYGIGTFVYLSRKPFDRMKLEEFASNWPDTVIRAKGIVWFSDDNEECFILEQAGKQITASYNGNWLATAPKRQIKEALAANPQYAKEYDEKVGDRMNKLVFIGRKMNKADICSRLDACTVEPTL